MPQFFPFDASGNKEIFNSQVTGNFSAVTPGMDGFFSLGMDRAVQAYTISEFSVTFTNEAATTGTGAFEIRLESKADGLGNAGWTTISTISTTLTTGTVVGTLVPGTMAIPEGSYVRVVPVTFRTDQQSFLFYAQGRVD